MPKGDIEAGKRPGEWKVKMVYATRGRREVGVVAWLASWPAEPVHGYMVTSYLPYLYNWSTGRPLIAPLCPWATAASAAPASATTHAMLRAAAWKAPGERHEPAMSDRLEAVS